MPSALLRVPIPDGWALSTLEVYAAEDWREVPDAGDLEAACAAYRAGGPYLTGDAPRRLVFTEEDAPRVAAGLVELCNTEDELAEGRNRLEDPERRRWARHASRGLSTLAARVWALVPDRA